MLKFTLRYLIFVSTCFGPPGPSSGSCVVAAFCHNTAKLITMYFY